MTFPRYALLASALAAAPMNARAEQAPHPAPPGPAAGHPAMPRLLPQTPCDRADLAFFTLDGLRMARARYIFKLEVLEERLASDKAMPEDIRARFAAARASLTQEVRTRDRLIAESEKVLRQEAAACQESRTRF